MEHERATPTRRRRSGGSSRPAGAVLLTLIGAVLGLVTAGSTCGGGSRVVHLREALPHAEPDAAAGIGVDSEIARYYLEEYRAGRGPDPSLNRRLAAWESLPAETIARREVLARIAETSGSVDLAALLFARTLGRGPLQAELDSRMRAQRGAGATRGSRFTVVFVPGFLWRSHPETGADLAAARELIDGLAIHNLLVATGESAPVEANARIVAETLARASRDGRDLIVVSASKGGPEVALALSRLPRRSSRVVAWINIGGVLGGTALADRFLVAPRCWPIDVLVSFKGWGWGGIRSLATAPSRERRARIAMPGRLLAVNLVPVPLSGTLSERALDGYRVLRELGPNDGVTLLADAVQPGTESETLVALGADHYFTGWPVDRLALAVLRTVEARLDGRVAGS